MPSLEHDELDSDFEFEDEEDGAMQVHDILRSPTVTNITTQTLHSLIHEGLVDLNPPYQRDVVWREPQQIGLIDSVFRNFYIPPVIFACTIDEDGEPVRVCVDGKQRLTSIQKFLDGQIPHKDPVTKKSYWFTTSDIHRKTRLEVPEYWKKIFTNKTVTCVEYQGLKPGTEREIFQRVQLGMPLTTAERLQAISSPWATLIGDLETQFVSAEDGLANVLQWDTKRGRDFQCIAQLIFCCDKLPEQTGPPSMQKLSKWLLRDDQPPPKLKSNIKDVLVSFRYIASRPELNSAFSKIQARVAPVEFVFIGVLLYLMIQSEYSNEERAKSIHQMRTFIRREESAIRGNTVVFKKLWAFIEGVVDGSVASDQKPRSVRAKRRKDSNGDVNYAPGSTSKKTRKTSG